MSDYDDNPFSLQAHGFFLHKWR